MYDEKLVTDNINLIYLVLKKMNLYSKTEEYFDIGTIGLVKAAKTFDPNKGYTFTTYACNCIYKQILRYKKDESRIKRKANYNTISLNTVIYREKDNEIVLEDVLPSNTNIEEEMLKKEQIDHLYIALLKLNEREQEIIYSCFGLNGVKKLTQKELIKKYNLNSQSSISRIKNRSIKKLRELLKEVTND